MNKEITLAEMDNHLKSSKGWIKEVCGYEYVYTFKIPSIPCVLIKVMSSISTGNKKNKGSDDIRVFAVKTDINGKIICGYIKKQRVRKTTEWKANLINAYMIVLAQVRVRARKDSVT